MIIRLPLLAYHLATWVIILYPFTFIPTRIYHGMYQCVLVISTTVTTCQKGLSETMCKLPNNINHVTCQQDATQDHPRRIWLKTQSKLVDEQAVSDRRGGLEIRWRISESWCRKLMNINSQMNINMCFVDFKRPLPESRSTSSGWQWWISTTPNWPAEEIIQEATCQG